MEKIPKIIKELAQVLPKFPDGRIDYSNAEIIPVVDVYVRHKDELLLLKRSDKVAAYPEKWFMQIRYPFRVDLEKIELAPQIPYIKAINSII